MYVLCGGGDLSDTVVGQITAAGTTQGKVSEGLWLHAMGVSREIRPTRNGYLPGAHTVTPAI